MTYLFSCHLNNRSTYDLYRKSKFVYVLYDITIMHGANTFEHDKEDFISLMSSRGGNYTYKYSVPPFIDKRKIIEITLQHLREVKMDTVSGYMIYHHHISNLLKEL